MSGEDSLRGVRSWPDGRDGQRQQLVAAVIAMAGERGFAELTVKGVVEQAGSHYRTFYRHFEGLEDAFGEGYEQLSRALCEELLASGRAAADWRTGFRAALRSFLAWVAADPARARVVLSEYRSAGGRAWRAHEVISERLAGAIDRVRIVEPERPLPPLAAQMLLGGIEFLVAARVREGEAASAPELESSLAYLAVSVFYGSVVAGEELGED